MDDIGWAFAGRIGMTPALGTYQVDQLIVDLDKALVVMREGVRRKRIKDWTAWTQAVDKGIQKGSLSGYGKGGSTAALYSGDHGGRQDRSAA